MAFVDKRKNYVRIDSNALSDDIFALLDSLSSDEEEDLDNLMNDSDTEFIVEEEAAENIEPSNTEISSSDTSILVPEANIHVVNDVDEGSSTDADKEKKKDRVQSKPVAKKSKKVAVEFKWRKKASAHIREPCNLQAEVLHDFPEYCTPYQIYAAVTDIGNLVKLIVTESNLYAQQKGRSFVTDEKEIKAFLGIKLYHEHKPTSHCSKLLGV